MPDEHGSSEWSVEEWVKAWTIKVGTTYLCRECGTMAMVTKGGVGVMEPSCCGQRMREFERPADAP